MPSNVRLLLKGLLVLSAKEGRTTGKVGILHAPPEPANLNFRHDLTITVTRQPPNGQSQTTTFTRNDIRPTLSLDLTGAAPPKIAFRNRNPVNRHVSVKQHDSVKWFVNLENSELYGTPIGGVDPRGFSSILTFNGGALFTFDKPNENILQIQRRRDIPYERFGRVALRLGIDFLTATKAVFKNGADTVFDSSNEEGTDYIIEITHDALEHPPVVEDANHYYTAVGTTIPPNQRILFKSESEIRLLQERLEEARLNKDKELERGLKTAIGILEKILGPPAGPEAACFVAYLDQTEI